MSDKQNAFYAQSGGVTAVINASAAGVIETARAHSDQIGTVYAGRNGIIGALTEDLIDTSAIADAASIPLKSKNGESGVSPRTFLNPLYCSTHTEPPASAIRASLWSNAPGGSCASGRRVFRMPLRFWEHHFHLLSGNGSKRRRAFC